MSTSHCTGHNSRPAVDEAVHAEGSKARGTVRASRMGLRRAMVLITIHVLALLHILHWQLTGETVSPLEPSEAMYTLRDGLVNAGAVLMLVATLSVLVVGRFFCGWACHMIAVQDFCAYLLKKAGIRPRPLSSRLLSWVPLGAAFVMFGMPLVYRYRENLGTPDWAPGFTKSEFWETFPGPWLTLTTFAVAGVLIIYVLGAKGFCTYACPYGGVFSLVEKLSPGRIRVTDACKACGHCTAVCTSNVQVAHEVHRFGMVVDTGCMKCLDCVSSCPEGALYFGMGRPAVFAPQKRGGTIKRKWSFSWRTEASMAVVFCITLAIFAGLPNTLAPWGTSLHGSAPLLLSLSLSAITAFLVGLVLRGLRAQDLAMTNHALRRAGNWTKSGRVFLCLCALWFAFVCHSGVVQYYTFRGNQALNTIDIQRWAWRDAGVPLPDDIEEKAATARRSFESAASAALFDDFRYPARLATIAVIEGDLESGVSHLRRAIAIEPDFAPNHSDLASLLSHMKRFPEALNALEPAIRLKPEQMDYQRQKYSYAVAIKDVQRSVEALEALAPTMTGAARRDALFGIVMMRMQLGEKDRAREALRFFKKENPADPRVNGLEQMLGN